MSKDRLVYSSETGRICPECQNPITNCRCSELKRLQIAGDGNVKLQRETKGRGGKSVVVVSGLALNQEQLKTLLGELKRRCGSGGTVKGNTIEIQGEHLDLLRNELTRRGFKPKG